eukprot:114688-Ditylum_brightwellii.AAC.1
MNFCHTRILHDYGNCAMIAFLFNIFNINCHRQIISQQHSGLPLSMYCRSEITFILIYIPNVYTSLRNKRHLIPHLKLDMYNNHILTIFACILGAFDVLQLACVLFTAAKKKD